MEQTSLDSYREIKRSEELGRMESIVLEGIKNNPDCTDAELTYILGYKRDMNKVRPRRNGLCKQVIMIGGYRHEVVCSGQKRCPMTGKTAKVWELVKL